MKRPYDLRHSGITWRLDSGVPDAQVAAWAGHSVEMLRRVYAGRAEGLEGIWITRMDPDPAPGQAMTRGSAPGGARGREPSQSGDRWHAVTKRDNGHFRDNRRPKARLALDKRGAPSRIRTCAHGSGGRCSLP